MKHYYHWGAIGDIIYSLPTVRAIGPGRYTTALKNGRHEWLAPLLEAQPYIEGVDHDPQGRMNMWERRPESVTHDLNRMRLDGKLHLGTLIESHAKAADIKLDCPWRPWLTVPGSEKQDRAVVARSFRYRDPKCNWDEEVERLRAYYGEVVFVGSELEWESFGRGLKHVPCATALEMAELISASRYFSGNQSAPLSLAIGLGVSHSVEADPGGPNCTFPTCPYQTTL